MIAYLLMLQVTSAAAASATAQDTWTCEYLAKDSTEPHDPLRPDLVLSPDDPARQDGSWTVIWSGKAPVKAETFPANFGSVGGSVALRWTEPDGKKQTAFVSYSDQVLANGTKAAWLGLGKPSLWQAPGYLCSTPPRTPKGSNQ